MCWENWKTIDNSFHYHTESKNPILKRDDHHAEIIDITDGLVVEEQSTISIDYVWDDETRMWGDLFHHTEVILDSVWDAFSNKKI